MLQLQVQRELWARSVAASRCAVENFGELVSGNNFAECRPAVSYQEYIGHYSANSGVGGVNTDKCFLGIVLSVA